MQISKLLYEIKKNNKKRNKIQRVRMQTKIIYYCPVFDNSVYGLCRDQSAMSKCIMACMQRMCVYYDLSAASKNI